MFGPLMHGLDRNPNRPSETISILCAAGLDGISHALEEGR